MNDRYMLTLVGQDKPGIVAALTSALFDAGASLGEASMIRLGNNFTVMVVAEFAAGESALREILSPVAERLELHLHIDPCDGRSRGRPVPDVRISVFGADRPGIIAQVTTALAQTGFNILDLESDVAGSEAEPVYILHIEGESGDGVDAVKAVLDPVARQGVDVEVDSIDTFIG